jgi:predicted phage terminase large subunit-like protein
MEDDELDELFLSCPPRIGKTTMVVMFLLWVMGRDPEKSNLYCSFTAKPVETFYDGLLEVLRDPVTYDYGSVFPGLLLVGTNANDATLDLGRKKRYHSFTGRPIGGSLNGSCDCYGYIVADDLVSGIEEALSKERMASLWYKVDNNFLTRAKEKCKRLWIGTRWSLVDPQGLRLDLLRNEPKDGSVRWKYINTPAVDANDESNFDYGFGVGFSTEYYQMRRASFERNNDMASWLAQYQGEPIERDGAIFNPDDLRYYNGTLPDCDADRVFMAVDPAWGGGDFVAGPVIYQYRDDLYVADVVYDNSDKRVTQPLIVKKVIENNVQALFIEATKMTASYPQEVDSALKEKGIKINIQSTTKHFTGTGKEQRIFDKAPDIRERMIFLESGKRSKEYEMFMQNLFSFSIGKKNKNDDAPDSLAIALSMAIFGFSNRVEIVKRPF